MCSIPTTAFAAAVTAAAAAAMHWLPCAWHPVASLLFWLMLSPHALDALIPALDNHASTQLEVKRLAAGDAAVKLLAVH